MESALFTICKRSDIHHLLCPLVGTLGVKGVRTGEIQSNECANLKAISDTACKVDP